MAESVETVAEQFPEIDFAIIDFSQAAMESKPANVRGLLFKEQEAGYLVGYLAGLLAAESAGANQTISSVGGQKIPPVDRYIAGFQAGAKKANARVKTLNGYSQDFVDQAKCKEIALNQIARGSSVVFQVAGQCGLGALNAAKEQNVSGIGVDADQGYLGEHVVTSALKKVDVAVFQTIQAVQDESFAGGRGLGLRRRLGRGRPRRDRGQRPRGGRDEGEARPGADRRRRAHGHSRDRRLAAARALSVGRTAEHPLQRHRIGRWTTSGQLFSSSAGSRSASRASLPTTTSASTCGGARFTRSSARTGRVSRR